MVRRLCELDYVPLYASRRLPGDHGWIAANYGPGVSALVATRCGAPLTVTLGSSCELEVS